MKTNIEKFYDIDGADYRFRRWQENPVVVFDYDSTYSAITDFLEQKHFRNALEIGCGPGTWTQLLAEHASRVTGVDLSETMLDQARKELKSKNIKFIHSDIMDFQSEEKFDLIFSIRALEYIQDKNRFFRKCCQLLLPGGMIFIITKTKNSYWYGRSRIRKGLKRLIPILFYYENKTLNLEKRENKSHFWQERVGVRKLVSMQRTAGFHHLFVRPVIIRPPIFMRGKSEIPIVPPFLEKPILFYLRCLDRALRHNPMFTFFAESYLVAGEKK